MRSKLMLVAVVPFALAAFGCNTLGDVYKEVAKGGYILWYPADSGVEAGQIWQVEGTKRIKEERAPDSLQVDTSAVQFETLSKTIDAQATLDTTFSKKLLGTAGELGAQLKAVGVKKIELQFGKTEVARITLGDLRNPLVISKFSPGYRDSLGRVAADDHRFVLIGAVLRAAGMKCSFSCDNAAALEAKAPEIAQAINAEFNVHVTSKTTAIWEIPESEPLTIAFIPVFGKDLQSRSHASFMAPSAGQPMPGPTEANKYQVLVDRLLASDRADATISFEDLR
jgi:hypothetical protein